ncbi:nitroreductase/quinone reductase family protein [Nocardia mangyaensis]|uniref:nitroreductase/quinone reductase family protein n=1 Tax=Nocardia mangyaensis TaxID=2213200 RepID=UPI0026771F7E|nr:nitroreductase/quinone reductase family protein [Nocardia mangyaensis]MDO3650426.1 nitroreductase/quinone reductase family protein [Nocardia mangyaensis]
MDLLVGAMFRARGGRLNLGPIEVIELTTVGRRSGRARTVLLASYGRTEHGYVVVGTSGGSARQPGWFHNLTADPHVVVKAAGRSRPMRARVTTGDERGALLRTYARRGYGLPALLLATALAGTRAVPVVMLQERSPTTARPRSYGSRRGRTEPLLPVRAHFDAAGDGAAR